MCVCVTFMSVCVCVTCMYARAYVYLRLGVGEIRDGVILLLCTRGPLIDIGLVLVYVFLDLTAVDTLRKLRQLLESPGLLCLA